MAGQIAIIDSYTDRDTWDAAVGGSPFGHFFQTWDWGELQRGLSAAPRRIAAVADGRIAGLVQLLVFDTGARRFAYVPRGPVCDPDDTDVTAALIEAVLIASYTAGADFVRVEPQWEFTAERSARLEQGGWTRAKQFIMPRRTILVDLRPGEDEIWNRFKSNTRNRIRLAEKLGVSVRAGGADDVATFVRLSEETAARHGMRHADPAQYELSWRYFGARDAMRLYLASAEGEDLAGLMVFICGSNATYLWGASSGSESARRMNPNQLLHWTAMRWARDRGCTTYDLHGVPDHDLEVLEAEYSRQTGGMWNLYRFKRGFGGAVYRFLGTFDRVFKKA